MNNKLFVVVYLLIGIAAANAVKSNGCSTQYEPNWDSLDSRPNPQWYLEAKFGIFIHWGVYSVPSWAVPGHCCPDPLKSPYAEWYWNQISNSSTAAYEFHAKTYGADFLYQEFAPMFRAELWEPDAWAQLFEQAGAKYVVLTSKHHEGYTLWPSAQSWNWNAKAIGPNRDIVGDLASAIRNAGLHFGLYYSLYEWYNPIYLNNAKDYIHQIMLPQMYDIVNTYQPEILWGDGCLDYSSDYWETPEFLAWLFNESPVCNSIAVNDRWGNDTLWKHGGFFVSEEEWPSPAKFGDHKFEDCRTLAYSFGYNRVENNTDYKTPSELIALFVRIIANGGNFLLNVGPTADGRIPVIMQNHLMAIGNWLKVNGDAIYPTNKWSTVQEGDNVYYTYNANTTTLYAIVTGKYPYPSFSLSKPQPTSSTVIEMLGYGKVVYSYNGNVLKIQVPMLTIDEMPCQYAYVFSISNISA